LKPEALERLKRELEDLNKIMEPMDDLVRRARREGVKEVYFELETMSGHMLKAIIKIRDILEMMVKEL
jgi:hypothetical protein